jgi:hypothetical protein
MDKRGQAVLPNPLNLLGAEAGTRTPTGVRPLDPEPSASTSSATSASKNRCNYNQRKLL